MSPSRRRPPAPLPAAAPGRPPAPPRTAALSAPLGEVAARWAALGRQDPMCAALTYQAGWRAEEFLATGRAEIDAVLCRLGELGVEPQRGTALDFGCGPGRLTAALSAAGFTRVIGVDIAEPMLDTARRLVASSVEAAVAARCEFRHNAGATLAGIADRSVHLVYTCRVLQHMPPTLMAGYLREFFRVSVPGGLVVFQLPAEPAPGVVGALLRRLPDRLLNRLRRGMQMHGMPPTEVTNIIAAAGGRTVAIEPDTSAGPRWRSYLYLAEAGPGSDQLSATRRVPTPAPEPPAGVPPA